MPLLAEQGIITEGLWKQGALSSRGSARSTPLGNDVKTTWENMKKGVNGIDTVTKFDASDYKCSLAGEVRGFDPTLYIPRGEVRRTDLFYAVRDRRGDAGV